MRNGAEVTDEEPVSLRRQLQIVTVVTLIGALVGLLIGAVIGAVISLAIQLMLLFHGERNFVGFNALLESSKTGLLVSASFMFWIANFGVFLSSPKPLTGAIAGALLSVFPFSFHYLTAPEIPNPWSLLGYLLAGFNFGYIIGSGVCLIKQSRMSRNFPG